MKTTAQQPRTSQAVKAKVNKQDSVSSILQRYKDKTAQLQTAEEEELLQGKFETVQRMQLDEEEPLQRKPNDTGLPDNLKSGIENLSGYNMDDVKVHYNSSQPATLQAHAYAQGTDIHVAPGQEKYLPHEAWHVVQQKQGRVQPTKQLKGKTNINDDAGLENEADVMGAKAMQLKAEKQTSGLQNTYLLNTPENTTQLKTQIKHTTSDYSYLDHSDNTRKNQIVSSNMEAYLDPDEVINGSATGGPQKEFIGNLRQTFPNDNMIRGHLLNHDLGGFGVEQNLFPITSAANGVHLRTVEYGVKDALKQANNDNKGVYYSVDVTGEFSDANDAPVSTFECTASYLEDVEDHTVQSFGEKILDVHVVSSPKKTGGKRAANLRGSAHDGSNGDVDNFSHSAGLSTWRHGGRAGKLNFDELIDNGKITSVVSDLAEPVADNQEDKLVKAQLFIDENEDEFGDIAAYIMKEKNYETFIEITPQDLDELLDGTDKALFISFLTEVLKFVVDDDEEHD